MESAKEASREIEWEISVWKEHQAKYWQDEEFSIIRSGT